MREIGRGSSELIALYEGRSLVRGLDPQLLGRLASAYSLASS